MKKSMACLFLGLFYINLQAQQYIVQYDMAKEDLRYLKIKRPGDTTRSAVIDMNRAKRINLQLMNTAGSYRQQIILHEKAATPESVVIPGLGSASSPENMNNIIGIAQNKANTDNLLRDIMKPGENKNFQIESANKNVLAQLFVKDYINFNASAEVLKRAIRFQQDCRQVWKEMAFLRYKLDIEAGIAKSNARKKMQVVFPDADENASTGLLLEKVIEPATQSAVVKKNYDILNQVYESFSSNRINSPSADSLMNEVTGQMQSLGAAASQPNSENTGDIVTRINDLYRQIINDPYTKLTPLNMNARTVMAEIQFTPDIDSVTSAITNIKAMDTISRWIALYKKEPLRFRNTFGFSFVSYAENRWKYFVGQDSVIHKTSGDLFQPVIVTFLHFYAPRDRGFRWGGCFGAGFPLSGDNKQLNLMLGLSTFLGKEDPVCLSAGISGAQVKKVYGVTPGDKVNSTEYIIPNNNVYRVGYFISLSFNPAGLNRKD